MSDQMLKVLELNPADYSGGIAIWGALPALYDTTSNHLPENGIHVHARHKLGGVKVIDDTFDVVSVQIGKDKTQDGTFTISSEDATSYNIASILKKRLKYLRCPACGSVHSDTGCHAVTYHQKHQCQICGTEFNDSEPSISNPIMLLKELTGDTQQDRPVREFSDCRLELQQHELAGGVQIWGSNPAILWTSSKLEESGIHVHGFRKSGNSPSIDETFSFVSIDGTILDPEMVRYLMAQESLPYLRSYLTSLSCPECGTPHFDKFDMATIPHSIHVCDNCHTQFSFGDKTTLTISNPLIDIRATLQTNS
jgi:transposase-like protein